MAQCCPWVHFVWPNPTKPNTSGRIWTQPYTTNNGAYSLVVTYFYTKNLACIFCQPSMFFTVITHMKNSVSISFKNKKCSKHTVNIPVPTIHSVVLTEKKYTINFWHRLITARCHQIVSTFAVVDPTQSNPTQPNPWTTLRAMHTRPQLVASLRCEIFGTCLHRRNHGWRVGGEVNADPVPFPPPSVPRLPLLLRPCFVHSLPYFSFLFP